MKQKIISTKENKLQQKQSIFYSSSTVFWGILNRINKLDTSISFLNHFLLKRNIKSVSLRLSIRDFSGNLIREIIDEINQPKVYSYSLSKIISPDIIKGEYSIYVEFTSKENLAVPFCAVTMSIISPNTVDQLHTYGRALEVNEIGSKIDFEKSYETGWSIRPGDSVCNFSLLHTGRLHSEINGEIVLFQRGNPFFKTKIESKILSPFSTLLINLNELLNRNSEGKEVIKLIDNSKYGDIEAKLTLNGLKAFFPRMLFASSANETGEERATPKDFKYIDITHSNFDFDKVEQGKSRINWGYINNPSYPKGIIDCGFRYYQCKDLNNLCLSNSKANSMPMKLEPLTSVKISSKENISSRLVGGNWVMWKKSPLIGECSTGTFIVEYVDIKGYWHWGLLNPSTSILGSKISLLNPFNKETTINEFTLNLYGNKGLIEKRPIKFKGKFFEIDFKVGNFKNSSNIVWYAIIGEGVGAFNIFATFFFDDLRDGSVEHSF